MTDQEQERQVLNERVEEEFRPPEDDVRDSFEVHEEVSDEEFYHRYRSYH